MAAGSTLCTGMSAFLPIEGGDVKAARSSRYGTGIPVLAGGALLLASAIATPSGAQQAPAQPLVPPLIAQACAGCHGQAGAGNGSVPKIAGYGRDLFVAQWAAFRNKERPATIMDRVARGYTDAEVAQLADYFSKLNK
jgi:sulfide dehydrogenase cytochrome subunit